MDTFSEGDTELGCENELDDNTTRPDSDTNQNAETGKGFLSSSASSSDESDDHSLAMEIWEDCDSETENEKEAEFFATEQGRKIHFVFSYFFLFFQLCYHVNIFWLLYLPFSTGYQQFWLELEKKPWYSYLLAFQELYTP